MTVAGCNDCHTPWKMGPNGPEPDMSAHAVRASGKHRDAAAAEAPRAMDRQRAATNTAWSGPWGVSFTANLTPDPETGLGKWTLRNFIDTIRTGRHMAAAGRSCRRCRSRCTRTSPMRIWKRSSLSADDSRREEPSARAAAPDAARCSEVTATHAHARPHNYGDVDDHQCTVRYQHPRSGRGNLSHQHAGRAAGRPGQFSFNQYLIVDDEPMLFHTGQRRLFPLVQRGDRHRDAG